MSKSVLLPAPPSVNKTFRNASAAELSRGSRGRLKTSTYKGWIKDAGMLLNAARLGRFIEPVAVNVRVGACNEARDLDNYGKAICDLLKLCGVIADDSLRCVHGVHIVRAFGEVLDGYVSVSVAPGAREAA